MEIEERKDRRCSLCNTAITCNEWRANNKYCNGCKMATRERAVEEKTPEDILEEIALFYLGKDSKQISVMAMKEYAAQERNKAIDDCMKICGYYVHHEDWEKFKNEIDKLKVRD